MVRVSGWIAIVAIVAAALVPIVARIKLGKRAAPSSRPISVHVVLGTLTTMLASGHSFIVLPELGSEAAIAGGMLAIAPGVVAFFVLFAHVGLGLQLRKEKLKDRAKKRRAHLATALTITIAAAVHAALLLRVR